MDRPYTVPAPLKLRRLPFPRRELLAQTVVLAGGRELVRLESGAMGWLSLRDEEVVDAEWLEGNEAVQAWIDLGLQLPGELELGPDWTEQLSKAYGEDGWAVELLAQSEGHQLHQITLIGPLRRQVLIQLDDESVQVVSGRGAFDAALAAKRGRWRPLTAPSETPRPVDVQAEAEALLRQFLEPGADRLSLTRSLAPELADYSAAFTGPAVLHAQKVYGQLWENARPIGNRLGDRSHLLMSVATTEDLAAWNSAARVFPVGWRRIVKLLAPGVPWVRWKYVRPGARIGLAFDGLAFVNGRFVWFPKTAVALQDLV